MKCVIVCESDKKQTPAPHAASELARGLCEAGHTVAYLRVEHWINSCAAGIDPFVYGEVYVLSDGTEVVKELGCFERACRVRLTSDSFLSVGSALASSTRCQNEFSISGRFSTLDEALKKAVRQQIERLVSKHILVLSENGWKSSAPDILLVDIKEAVLGSSAISHGLDAALFEAIDHVIFSGAASSDSSNTRAERGECTALFINTREVPLPAHWSSASVSSISDAASVLGGASAVRSPAEIAVPAARRIVLGLAADGATEADPYCSVVEALEEAGRQIGCQLDIVYVRLDAGHVSLLQFDGIVISGGFGQGLTEAKMDVIRHARKNNVPLLGICLGFQLAVLEFCRSVLGLEAATSTEFDPATAEPVIISASQVVRGAERRHRMYLGEYYVEYSGAGRDLYGVPGQLQKFRHGYALNSEYASRLQAAGMEICGKTPDGRLVMFVLRDHPFFCGVQYHPELSMLPGSVDEVFVAFCSAAQRMHME